MLSSSSVDKDEGVVDPDWSDRPIWSLGTDFSDLRSTIKKKKEVNTTYGMHKRN